MERGEDRGEIEREIKSGRERGRRGVGGGGR